MSTYSAPSEDCSNPCTPSSMKNVLDDHGDGVQYVNPDAEIESLNSTMTQTPDGTKSWVPNVLEEIKPVVDSVFNSLDEAEIMYNRYALESGFSTRRSTTRKNVHDEITVRYFLCSKAGVPRKKQNVDTLQVDIEKVKPRNCNISVTDCKAGIKLSLVRGTCSYKLYEFKEVHNHPLVSAVNKHLLRTSRQLQFGDEDFLQQASTCNIGPTVAHRLQASLKGGYDKVNGTEVDYKNCRRDINKYIGNADAQMVVNMLTNRKQHAPNFSFDYMSDENELGGIFWADEVSKFNYIEFGHVMAFDATFRTNKYGMIFVPFTGINNHNKSVCFGAGLLKDESVNSYVWLLEAFLKARVKQPNIVVTDQDPSMKIAVPTVFNESHHRFCMWHIMNKLPLKITGDNQDSKEIRKRLHKLVWNSNIGTKEFERRWGELISEFSLSQHKWLGDMFNIRQQWIPAYYKHIPMYCLMRTTSQSESSNSMFRKFLNFGHTLVQFMLCFEAAMEKQRYKQRRDDFEDTTKIPKMDTQLPIERHASSIYTITLFGKVQHEIVRGMYSCSLKTSGYDEEPGVFMIKHFDQHDKFVGDFKVRYNADEATVVCSCNLFGQQGYLCRHVFCVFNSEHVKEIPEKYILRRWSSNLMPRDTLYSRYRYGVQNDSSKEDVANAMLDVESCISRFRSSQNTLDEFLTRLNELTSEFKHKVPDQQSQKKGKAARFGELAGDAQTDFQLNAPPGIRNKGCGTGKRLKGPGERAIEKAKYKDEGKKCQVCLEVGHNSRTCGGPSTYKGASSSKRQKR